MSSGAGEEHGPCLAVDGQGVTFRFGKRGPNVLNGLDIAVERGIIYGLLGPSGCGKTTLLRCLVGRHTPSAGSIRVYGRPPGQPGFPVPGPGVGFMPQELALYPEITVCETLTFFGRLYQMDSSRIRERISFLTRLLDIPDKGKLIKNLSGGQQRRVSFAAALIHKPPLVILDEPTVGVDPLLRKSIWNHMQTLAEEDCISIVITTHYVEEARQAHVVGLMREGRLLAETNPQLLLEQYSAATLEDVFLRLCVHQEATPINHADLGETDEASSLVWVPRKSQKRVMFPDPSLNKKRLSRTSAGCAVPDIAFKGGSSCGSEVRASADRMAALVAKNFCRLKRNIPLVFFQMLVPAFQVVVFCLCVGGEPTGLPLAVVNREVDPSGKSGDFLATIPALTIRQINFTNLTEAFESAKRGESWGVLHIGPKFTDANIDRYLQGISADNETIEDSTIKLYLDMTNQQIAMTIYQKLMLAFLDFAEELLKMYRYNPAVATAPIVLEKPIYGDLEPNFTEFMAPGMVLGITYIMAVGMGAMSIILERQEGLLDRSWVAGVRAWEVVVSIFLAIFLTMVAQVALVLVITFNVFHLPCRGPLAWVVVAVLLVGLEGLAYGLFISSIVNDINFAVMIAMGSFYPNLLMSGIIWPVEAMPYVLEKLSYCLPMTMIADSMRSILSRGWDITDKGVWEGYLVTLAWILPVFLISSLIFMLKK